MVETPFGGILASVTQKFRIHTDFDISYNPKRWIWNQIFEYDNVAVKK